MFANALHLVVSAAPRQCAAYFGYARAPKPHRGGTSAALVRRFASDGITYALTSPPLFRNSIARGGSLFCKSRGSGKLRAPAQNAILLARDLEFFFER